MSQLLYKVVFGISGTAKNWTIIKNKFLVPAKPKKPFSAYFLYANQNRSNIKGSVTDAAKQLGAQWKQLSPQQKLKYQQQAKKLSDLHKTELQQYESKFVQPFKSVNSASLAVKKMYSQSTQKIANIDQGSKKLASIFKELTTQDKQKLAAQAKTIKAERAIIQSKFEIPQPQFKTQRSFINQTLRSRGLPSFSLLIAADQEKICSEYKEYFENFNKTLDAFAKNHNLTLQQLKEIIKINQRKLKKEEVSEETVNQLGAPQKPEALKKKRTIAGKRPTKTAKRTRVTKKAGSKKTDSKPSA